MIVGVEYRGRVVQTVERGIYVPQWLHEYAEDLAADPRVVSVALFGSRANGHAHDDSDWDVAVLHTESRADWSAINLGLEKAMAHEVDYVPHPHKEYASHLNAIGSLGYEISHTGMLLAGEPLLQPLPAEHDVIDTPILTRMLKNTYVNLGRTLLEICKEHRDQYPEEASRYSSDTAEYITKALCIHCQVGYAKTHDLDRLAQNLPGTLRQQIISMNGGNVDRHIAQYEGLASPETMQSVLTRVSTIFTLLDSTAQAMFSHLSKGEKEQVLTASSREVDVLSSISQTRPDPSYDPWRALVGRYQRQVDQISNYIGPSTAHER